MTTALKTWRIGARKSAEEVAVALGVTLAMWSRWETGARQVPATRATEVSAVTGIPLHELRPDVFPAPKPEAIAS